MRVKNVDVMVAGTTFLAILVVSSLVGLLVGAWAAVGLALAITTTIQVTAFLEQRANHRNVEAMFSVFSVLRPQVPLPPMRGRAISPDLATLMISVIHETSPERVVELGSGRSTVIAAIGLQAQRQGTLLALEHDDGYAERTRRELRLHLLDDVAEVVTAPLQPVRIAGREWTWYETTCLERSGPFDLVIVDGPPGRTLMAPYPALPGSPNASATGP